MEKEMIEERVRRVRNYLCGYRFCVDMLHLRGYERKRQKVLSDVCEDAELIAGDEMVWRSRMYEVQALIESMKNGKAKLILYYRYIRGESIEFAANMIGISRRTGYRWHDKGLLQAAEIFEKREKTEGSFLE